MAAKNLPSQLSASVRYPPHCASASSSPYPMSRSPSVAPSGVPESAYLQVLPSSCHCIMPCGSRWSLTSCHSPSNSTLAFASYPAISGTMFMPYPWASETVPLFGASSSPLVDT